MVHALVIRLGLLLTIVFSAAACSGVGAGDLIAPSDPEAEFNTTDTGEGVTRAPDSVVPNDVLSPSDSTLGDSSVTGDGDSPPEPDTDEHGFGTPCDSGEDCYSGLCAEHMGDTVCTETCNDTCRQGGPANKSTSRGATRATSASHPSSTCVAPASLATTAPLRRARPRASTTTHKARSVAQPVTSTPTARTASSVRTASRPAEGPPGNVWTLTASVSARRWPSL
jgi:hypothetical protein